MLQAEGISSAMALRQERAPCAQRSACRPVGRSRVSRGLVQRGGPGQGKAGLVGLSEDLGFYFISAIGRIGKLGAEA